MVVEPTHSNELESEVVDSPTDSRGWTPRLIVGMVAILLVVEAVAMGYLMISTSLPYVAAHYQTDQSAWMLNAFAVVGAISAPLIGKLADMHGKRLLLILCTIVGIAGYLVSAIAPNYGVMLVGRAMTGVLCAALFLAYSLIRDVFPKKIVPLAVSIATVGLGVVAVPAPFLTGYLLDNHGFRSIFWFFVVLLAVAAALMLVLDESTVRVNSSIDFLGAGLLGAGIAGVLIGLSFGPSWGWTAVSTLTYIVGGVVFLALWVASAKVVSSPLIDMHILTRRSVLFTTLCAGIAYGVTAMFAAIVPIMVMVPEALGLNYGWGLSAEDYALFLMPFVFAIVAGGLSVGMLVSRGISPRILMFIGLISLAVSFTLIALNHSNEVTIMLLAVICGYGQGLSYATVPNLVIESVAPELQATTASIATVAQSVFPAVVIAISFSILNNSHVAMVAEGVTFYSTGGFKAIFCAGAAVAVVGAGIAYALPRHIVQMQVGDASAEEPSEAAPTSVAK